MFPTAKFRNEERAEYIEKQKNRQELRRQQEERVAATMKAAEKTPYEKSLDKQEVLKQLVHGIQGGDPRNEEHIITVLKQVCDILDFCLSECKPEISPGDKRPEE
jgi:hypothetical protein